MEESSKGKKMRLRARRDAFLAALTYFVASALWILFSDKLVAAAADDRSFLSTLQSYKGVAFVVVTACIIYVLLHRHLSRREILEEQLRAGEARYRQLFETNPLPMWVYDLETLRFLAVNDAAIANYGYSREEFLAMTIQDIRPPEDSHRLRENVAAVTEGLDHAGI